MRGIIGFALSLLVLNAHAQSITSVKDLGFLSGCWASKTNSEEYRECFTAPYAGMIQGSTQTVKNGKTVSFEFAVISEKDSKITYAPFYNGQALSVFTLTQAGPDIAVFENPANDFPKKVIYHRNADGTLSARTVGSNDNDPKNQEWIMRPQGM